MAASAAADTRTAVSRSVAVDEKILSRGPFEPARALPGPACSRRSRRARSLAPPPAQAARRDASCGARSSTATRRRRRRQRSQRRSCSSAMTRRSGRCAKSWTRVASAIRPRWYLTSSRAARVARACCRRCVQPRAEASKFASAVTAGPSAGGATVTMLVVSVHPSASVTT